MRDNKELIIVRGGGDLATGVIHKLWNLNKKILVLETEQPAAIRRLVAFSEAIYEGEAIVEGVKAVRINGVIERTELEAYWNRKEIPILVDPSGASIGRLKPEVVIDAIMAKRNLGTHIEMAPLTIALGPGFCAGKDVHFVIETMRGTELGRVISEGYAIANTGVPGAIMGIDRQRVIHAPYEGRLFGNSVIGDKVKKGDAIAWIGERHQEVYATIDGVLRGLIRDGYMVKKGFKIADIDPRNMEDVRCNEITDKARKIAESVRYVL